MVKTERQVALRAALLRAVEPVLSSFKVPGLSIAVAHGDDPVVRLVIGTDAAGVPLTRDSLFPVASISKLSTALAALRLVDAGAIELDTPLVRYLPDAAAAQPGVTLRALLSHTAGMPEDLTPESAPYAAGLAWRTIRQACIDTPLDLPPGTRVHYSNVGYGLIAIAVERQTGQAFPDALDSLVLRPLGIEAYLGSEPSRTPVALADVRSTHTGTPLEPYNSPFWRALGVPWGGLITTAEGGLRLSRAFSEVRQGFLSPGLQAEATRNQTGNLGGGYGGIFTYRRCAWGLGPDLRDAKQPHWAPQEASPETFGHAGASGSVVWNDPVAGVAWAILGARTADNGWLLRATPSIGQVILEALS